MNFFHRHHIVYYCSISFCLFGKSTSMCCIILYDYYGLSMRRLIGKNLLGCWLQRSLQVRQVLSCFVVLLLLFQAPQEALKRVYLAGLFSKRGIRKVKKTFSALHVKPRITVILRAPSALGTILWFFMSGISSMITWFYMNGRVFGMVF